MVKGRIAEGYNRCLNVIDLGMHKIYVSLSQIVICVELHLINKAILNLVRFIIAFRGSLND